jgi:membrane protein YqaA with SNARE-associated domain
MKRVLRTFAAALTLLPSVALAQFDISVLEPTELPNAPIANIIGSIMNWLLGILGFLAIIAFVISGILYLTSGGNQEQVERAKRSMVYAIVGVVVALMGLVVVKAVFALLSGESAF